MDVGVVQPIKRQSDCTTMSPSVTNDPVSATTLCAQRQETGTPPLYSSFRADTSAPPGPKPDLTTGPRTDEKKLASASALDVDGRRYVTIEFGNNDPENPMTWPICKSHCQPAATILHDDPPPPPPSLTVVAVVVMLRSSGLTGAFSG